MTTPSLLRSILSESFLISVDSIKLQPVGGGCINETYKLSINSNDYFCKVNSAIRYPGLFKKESYGLALIHQTGVIKVPAVIKLLEEKNMQILVMEWMEEGEKTGLFWKTFGEQLANLHSISNNEFGLEEDNYMGSIFQRNTFHGAWNEFFWQERMAPLLQLCREDGLLHTKHLIQFESIRKNLTSLFGGHTIPSLVHGDLWNGNYISNSENKPVLIDPAVHYGHHLSDIGMTRLFGGFTKDFYESYEYYFPSSSDSSDRIRVCNLYPLLIHLKLFGKGYLGQIEEVLHQFN